MCAQGDLEGKKSSAGRSKWRPGVRITGRVASESAEIMQNPKLKNEFNPEFKKIFKIVTADH